MNLFGRRSCSSHSKSKRCPSTEDQQSAPANLGWASEVSIEIGLEETPRIASGPSKCKSNLKLKNEASEPSISVDDATAVSGSSWAKIDITDPHTTQALVDRLYNSDGVLRYNNKGEEKDDASSVGASVSVSVSSWANIDTDPTVRTTRHSNSRLHNSDSAIRYRHWQPLGPPLPSHTANASSSKQQQLPPLPKKKPTSSSSSSSKSKHVRETSWGRAEINWTPPPLPHKQKQRQIQHRSSPRGAATTNVPPRPPPVTARGRETSWGNAEVLTMMDIQEAREQAAQVLLSKQARRASNSTASTCATGGSTRGLDTKKVPPPPPTITTTRQWSSTPRTRDKLVTVSASMSRN